MFESMRKVFGPIAVTFIIGAIALVFVFYGVFNPKGGSLGAGGAGLTYAAKVNGDVISGTEFAREYQRRMQYFESMMKGGMSPEMLEKFGIKNQVVEELIRRKLLLQEAERLGLMATDDEVRDQIQEMPYFKKDGRFDPQYYQSVLKANRQSPTEFEEMIRSDLVRNSMLEYVRGRSRISETEVQREYLNREDRRQIDYVLISRDDAKKMLMINPKEIENYLSTENGLKTAKEAYENRKFLYVKIKNIPKSDSKKKEDSIKTEYFSFDEVKTKVATDLLREQRSEELHKIVTGIADEVLGELKKNPSGLKAIAKAKGLDFQTTAKFNKQDLMIKGLGDLPELTSDAFKENTSLLKEPKLYSSRGSAVIVTGLKTFKPDLSAFSKEREKLTSEVLRKKEEFVFTQWMGALQANAKIKINEELTKPSLPSASDE